MIMTENKGNDKHNCKCSYSIGALVRCVRASTHVPLRFIDTSRWTHKNKISVVSIVRAEAINLSRTRAPPL